VLKQFLLKFSILLALISTACANPFINHPKLKPLNIAFYKNELNLVNKLVKQYNHKQVLISNLSKADEAKIISSLIDGSMDLFIGNLNLPKEASSSIESEIIAKDALVIVTSKDNPVNNIPKAQLRKILSKEIKNWKELHGKNEPILVVDRETNSIEKETIYAELFDNGESISNTNIMVSNIEEVKSTINKFPNAISYVSFSNLDPSLKAVHIDNIPANRENIKEGYFPLTREIRIYYNRSKLKSSQKLESLESLLDFIYSKGQETVSKAGYMPLSSAEIELIQLKTDPIYIGVAVPLEEPYIDLGHSIVNAAKLAIEESNLQGNIGGRPLALIVCNDKATLKDAINCANKFVDAKVSGVIGHLTSQSSIEASKIYAEHHIVQISPASTHPWFTERPGARGYVFRTAGRDDLQAQLISDLITGLKKVHPIKVTIFNNGTIYGSTLSTLVENELSKTDTVKVVGSKSLVQDASQYHKEVTALNCDVLVFIGEYGDAAQIVKELALSAKPNITFIGADGIFSQGYIESAGLRAEGTYVTGSALDSSPELIEEWGEKFKTRFKTEASPFAMNSYDSTQILIEAIKASVANKTSINEEVAKTHYQGVTGLISFNSIGDTIQPRMSIYKVSKGQFVKHEKFAYSEN
jgi:branched-chain amino acid transport system substrate-binding protein